MPAQAARACLRMGQTDPPLPPPSLNPQERTQGSPRSPVALDQSRQLTELPCAHLQTVHLFRGSVCDGEDVETWVWTPGVGSGARPCRGTLHRDLFPLPRM